MSFPPDAETVRVVFDPDFDSRPISELRPGVVYTNDPEQATKPGPDPETSKNFRFFETLLDSAQDAHPGSKAFYNNLIEAALLHSQKSRDYGRTQDPFANVRASEDFGVPGWVGCMIRANDKIRRLQTFAQTGSLTNEGVRDSFLDLAVYALIGLTLYEEENSD